MREILFRGKSTINNEWEYGVPVFGGLNNETAYMKQMHSYDCRVDPETVGQYTGLEDKNGRKIFDGDILELDGEDGFFKLEYEDDTARFVMIGDYFMVDFDNFWNRDAEVIGNIYDHPELVGGEEERR